MGEISTTDTCCFPATIHGGKGKGARKDAVPTSELWVLFEDGSKFAFSLELVLKWLVK